MLREKTHVMCSYVFFLVLSFSFLFVAFPQVEPGVAVFFVPLTFC